MNEAGIPEIVKNIFNLLAISITVAAFVPAIVYSYFTSFSNKMVNEIKGGNLKLNNKEDKDWVEKIVGLSHSLDLTLVMVLFVILFTSIINFVLFLYSHIHENSELQILSQNSLLSILVVCSLVFLLCSILFWIYTLCKTKKWVYNKFWKHHNLYINIIFILVIGYSIILFVFSIRLCVCKGNLMDNEIIIVSSSTLMVIFLVVSWIIPIFVYRPLFTEIDKAIKTFKTK